MISTLTTIILVGVASAFSSLSTLFLTRAALLRWARREEPAKAATPSPPPPRTWSALEEASYEMTLPMTIVEAEPVEDVLDHLPKLMAERVRKDVATKGIVTIEPGHYTVRVQCIAQFTKRKAAFR